MVQNREILGKGFKFPFRIGGDSLSHDGPEQSKFEQHVLEGIQQLVLVTRKSLRYKREFGGRLFELSFEILTRSPGLAVQFIEDVMEQERRVELLGTYPFIAPDKSLVEVRTDIQFINTPTKANLVFPFYRDPKGRPSLTEVRITLT